MTKNKITIRDFTECVTNKKQARNLLYNRKQKNMDNTQKNNIETICKELEQLVKSLLLASLNDFPVNSLEILRDAMLTRVNQLGIIIHEY